MSDYPTEVEPKLIRADAMIATVAAALENNTLPAEGADMAETLMAAREEIRALRDRLEAPKPATS